jgi:hypothetical protein
MARGSTEERREQEQEQEQEQAVLKSPQTERERERERRGGRSQMNTTTPEVGERGRLKVG